MIHTVRSLLSLLLDKADDFIDACLDEMNGALLIAATIVAAIRLRGEKITRSPSAVRVRGHGASSPEPIAEATVVMRG
jgi:hypothetical protein